MFLNNGELRKDQSRVGLVIETHQIVLCLLEGNETQLEARGRAKYRVWMSEPIREVDPARTAIAADSSRRR